MNIFKNIIEKNKGVDFVVHVKTKEELDELITALEDLEFEYTVPFLGSLREMADNFVADDGYDGCWRISEAKGIAYNPSIEHWRFFTSDIVEVRNGEFLFHDSYSTIEEAQIEAEKLWKDFTDEEEAAIHLKLFGLQDASREEILSWLKEKFRSVGELDCTNCNLLS